MITTSLKATADLHENDPLKQVFTEYSADLLSLTAEEKADKLMEDWRYARWRNTDLRTRAIFEVAISPEAAPLAGKVMTGFMKIIKLKAGGETKHGVAPKTAIELRR